MQGTAEVVSVSCWQGIDEGTLVNPERILMILSWKKSANLAASIELVWLDGKATRSFLFKSLSTVRKRILLLLVQSCILLL